MLQDDMYDLMEKYLNGTATVEEEQKLLLWYRSVDHSHIEIPMESPQEKEIIRRRILSNFENQAAGKPLAKHSKAFSQPRKKNNQGWWRIAAAIIIIIFSTAFYFWFNHARRPDLLKEKVGSEVIKNDISPGGDKATLTLADGTQIVLDSAANGTLTQQGNAKVVKLTNGQLAYHTNGTSIHDILYNTMNTPRGGQYKLTLPDGSQVWLNAASSIRYPTAFAGSERRVEITGEAYFEVVKNTSMPFIVKVNGAEVRVLGTHFNVMAYADETAIKTTLLEGAVKMTKGSNSSLLKPGQQAQLTQRGQLNVINDADIEEAVAWKNGRFQFNGNSIQSVMRQLSRWYDVEVSYEGNLPDANFMGGISRQENVSQVLKMLELTKAVKFSIQGKKIIVMK